MDLSRLDSLPPISGQSVAKEPSSAYSSLDFVGFDLSHLNLGSDRENGAHEEGPKRFADYDAEETVKCCRRSFQILNPGDHASKRSPEHGSISFLHCKNAVTLGAKYVQLRELMQQRAKLELMRDCVARLKSLSSFVKELETLVLAECKALYNITHFRAEAVETKLGCLNSLCEDLRTQIGHWNCIRQKLHTNRWLQPILGTLYFQVEAVRIQLTLLKDKAISWLELMISIGLQVFAHTDVDRVTHELIWNITRGLEDFNNIVGNIKTATPGHVTSSSLGLGSCSYLKWQFLPKDFNMPLAAGSGPKAFPLTKFLSILAHERSEYAALATHKFFTMNDGLTNMLHTERLQAFSWLEELVSSNRDTMTQFDTSDYHTASGSTTSLTASLLKIGNIRAPDVSNLMSPLVDIARKEQTFAEMLLQIVCNSTNLLHKKESANKSRRVVRLAGSGGSPSSPRASLDHGETPVLSRSDSLRKSVSWGDSADSSMKSTLVTRFMDMLWTEFGLQMFDQFQELCWDLPGRVPAGTAGFGSILLYDATVVAMISHMMEHACLKDLFPAGSVSAIMKVARANMYRVALATWDSYLCSVLGSQLSDKCYPCPLANQQYSTRTGMLLRDTFQPLTFMLNQLVQEPGQQGQVPPNAVLPQEEADFGQIISLATRIHVTSAVAYHWCNVKSHHFLSSWAVANFLLISQTDLKLLSDECRRLVFQMQRYCKKCVQKPCTVEHLQSCMSQIVQTTSKCSDHLQCLPGVTMKLFSSNCWQISRDHFKTNMPVGRVWRRKAAQDVPSDHSMYVENAMEAIMEPVIEGVSKLKQTDQLSVISMATGAVCDALTSFILKEKIKFSYFGAQQLEQDIALMRSWLSQAITNDSVRQSILDLTVFRQLAAIVALLKRQPLRRASRFRDSCSTDDINSESTVESDVSGLGEIIPGDADFYMVENMEEWLALRVHGGGKPWRLPCFKPQSSEA